MFRTKELGQNVARRLLARNPGLLKLHLQNTHIRALSNISDDSKLEKPRSGGIIERWFGLESSTAPESFTNRWLMAVPGFTTHLCLGAPYAWSLMADLITREYGFVAPAASDWTMMEAALPLSMVFLALGMSASVLGNWQNKVGVRKAMFYSSLAFGGGVSLGALGIYFHSLPLLYAGYGLMGGTGMGLAYTPPLQTLIQWFPDRKAFASGIAIAGFGSAPLLFTPAVQYLSKQFAKLPTYLGPAQDFVTKTIDGRLFVELNGSLVEVVNAGAAELSKLPYQLSEGLYVVGSGSSGAAEALGVMGLAYFATLFASALVIRNPHPKVAASLLAGVAGSSPASKGNGKVAVSVPVPGVTRDATLSETMRAPQFYFMGATLYCLAMGSMGLFSVAKSMMSEIFSTALPAVVTSSFAATYVMLLSTGNLTGRVGWAAISDIFGCRKTLMWITAGSIPIYLSIPTLVEQTVVNHSVIPLYLFCVATATAMSGIGGVYSILPSYEADYFGPKNVGAIHGRMLMFSSLAAVSGPTLIVQLRAMAESSAVTELLTKVSPEMFEQTFGAPMEKASELLAAKTLNIGKLLALCPPGTIDPTPHLYDMPMYALSALAATACLSNYMVRPYKLPPADIIDVTATPALDNTKGK